MNQSLYYYGDQCHDIADFCNIDGLQSFNATHCLTNTSEAIRAEKAVKRVSASEDYFRFENSIISVQTNGN